MKYCANWLPQSRFQLSEQVVVLWMVNEAHPMLKEDQRVKYAASIAQYQNSLQSIQWKHVILDFMKGIRNKHITKQELKQLIPYISGLKEVAKRMGQQDSIPSITNYLQEFKHLRHDMKQLRLVRKWLESVHLDVDLPAVPPLTDELTLHLLSQYYNEAETTLSRLFRDGSVIKTLGFFLSRKSSLFEALSQEHLQTLSSEVAVKPQAIELIIDQVSNFLKKLLHVEMLCLNDFQPVYEITNRFKHSFQEELDIVYGDLSSIFLFHIVLNFSSCSVTLNKML